MVKRASRLMMVLAVIGKFTLGGCSHPHLTANLPQVPPASARAWSEAIEVTTSHYRILTDSDPLAAEHVSRVLETVYAVCEAIIGPAREHGLLNVYIFSKRSAYESQVASLNLPKGRTTGFFAPTDPPGIYLPLVESNKTHPYFSLVHEAVHQYLHEAQGIAIHNATARLPSVPLWLNEGLALYLEAALVEIDRLQPGRLHVERLEHLQGLLKRGRGAELKQVVTKTYGEPFGNADYSAAWGLVHALREDAGTGGDWASFWASWREAVNHRAAAFLNKRDDKDLANLLEVQEQWARQLGQLSGQFFQEHVVGSGRDWSEWDNRWQSNILLLRSDQ